MEFEVFNKYFKGDTMAYNDLSKIPIVRIDELDKELSKVDDKILQLEISLTERIKNVEDRLYIKDFWQSDVFWYRIWSDGWIEQGGVNNTSATTFTFFKPFKDTNYSFIAFGGGHYGSGADIAPYLTGKYTTYCTIAPDRTTNYNWYASGY